METDPAQVNSYRLLEWDSAFFGFRIARLLSGRLDRQTAADALSWCKSERIRCLYFLAGTDSTETVESAAQSGFRLTDIRITLARKTAGGHGPADNVRACRAADVAALRAIAAVSHRDSRFYYDPGFPEDRCDALYATWIELSCQGYAKAVLVAEHDSEPAGYISCHIDAEGAGSIGLVAVAEHARGRGLGPQLVAAAMRYFGEMKCDRVTVVTQGRNCAAQRLYQNCGFRTADIGIWYHRWFEPVE